MKLTKPQQRAIAALVLLCEDSRSAGFSRWNIGRAAKHDLSSYPIRTMRALQRHGLCEPVCDVAAELVETGQCRCGCDLWKPTDKARDYVATLKVNGGVKAPSFGLTDEQIRRMLGQIFGEHDAQDTWWREGENPPGFDPEAPSQRPELKDEAATA